jgi:uncharacterized protein (DUF362 family)/ferredoxin-like protein FixX
MSKVAVVKVDEIDLAVEKAMQLIGAEKVIKKGDRVLLKPNLCLPTRKPETITSPEVIKALAEWVKKQGAKPFIAESPIVGTGEIFKSTGYSELGMETVDLRKVKPKRVKISGARALHETVIGGISYDKLISVPVMKTHMMALVTLSLKNMMGMVPGRAKHELHNVGLHAAIADLNKVVRPDISLIDAITCMEALGPTSGDAKKMDLVIASLDPVAADTVGSKIMGINPKKVEHIVMAEKDGIGSMTTKVVGERIEDVASGFEIPYTFKMSGGVVAIMDRANRIKNKLSRRLFRVESDNEKCNLCKNCIDTCPEDAITVKDGKIKVDKEKCNQCLCCVEVCEQGAMKLRRLV